MKISFWYSNYFVFSNYTQNTFNFDTKTKIFSANQTEILTISEVKNLKIAHLFSNSVTNRVYTPDFKMSYPNY